MKKLTNVSAHVVDGKLTVTADVVEVDKSQFRFPIQQTTIGHVNPKNPHWVRHIQLSGDAVFVKAYGNGMVIFNDDMAEIAKAVEPLTTFSPKVKIKPDFTVDIASELEPSLQWQVLGSVNPEAKWTDIDGQTTNTLDKSTVKKGQFVRLVAASDAGSMVSNVIPIQ